MSKDTKVRVRAIVTLTVEVDVSDAWGGDCSMSQVSKQARESAMALLHPPNHMNPEQRLQDLAKRTRIVGTPLVKAIAVEEER